MCPACSQQYKQAATARTQFYNSQHHPHAHRLAVDQRHLCVQQARGLGNNDGETMTRLRIGLQQHRTLVEICSDLGMVRTQHLLGDSQ